MCMLMLFAVRTFVRCLSHEGRYHEWIPTVLGFIESWVIEEVACHTSKSVIHALPHQGSPYTRA